MACQKFGGRLQIWVEGQPVEVVSHGDLTIGGSETTARRNVSGSKSVSAKPELYRWEGTLEYSEGINWDALTAMGCFTATLIEQDNGRVHTLLDADWEGQPKFNLENGEVTGLALVASGYRVQDA